MANRYGFLIDTVAGGSKLDLNSNEFDVRGYAVRLVLGGAINGDVVQVQVLAGNGEASPNGTWADLAYNGTSIQLTNTNTQFVLVVEGRYRVTYGGASTQLQVYMEEDTIGIDQRTIAMFPTANNAGAAGATGPSGLATIPFSDKVASFGVASTSHGYRVTTNTTATATLPAATTAVGCVYVFEAEGTGVVTIAPTGADLINGANVSVDMQSASSWILYSNGIDGYSLVVNPQAESPVVDVPTTGQTKIISASTNPVSNNIYLPAGTLASLTLTLEPGTLPGQVWYISFGQIITSLTYTATNLSSTTLTVPTSATKDSCHGWVWNDGVSGGAVGWVRFL